MHCFWKSGNHFGNLYLPDGATEVEISLADDHKKIQIKFKNLTGETKKNETVSKLNVLISQSHLWYKREAFVN